MTRRPLPAIGAIVTLVLLVHGPAVAQRVPAQHTFAVKIEKNGRYRAVYTDIAKPSPFYLMEGDTITWNFTNGTGAAISIRAADFKCNYILFPTAPPTCPLDLPGCQAEQPLAPNDTKAISGVAMNSGCKSTFGNARLHKFNFIVASGPDTPQKIDPRLDIEEGGRAFFPVIVVLLTAATAVLVATAFVIYRRFTRGRRSAS